jgi:hypothetical protein
MALVVLVPVDVTPRYVDREILKPAIDCGK